MSILVSLIVPLFNEEKGIPMLAGKLRQLEQQLVPKYELEVVLVDDGSKDQTLQAITTHFSQFSNVRVLEHGINRGAGAAMRTGFAGASGSILCTIDAGSKMWCRGDCC
jgi:dolichol-phosphate mannosyltransferase